MGMGNGDSKENTKIFITKDVQFFGKLYERYYANMVLFAEGLIYDEDEAKDLVQDVFTDLWNNPKIVHVYNSMKTYLYSCVKNKAFNRIKKLNIIDKHQDQLTEAYLFSCETQTHTNEKLKKQIHDALNNMPPKMREVIDMSVLQEMKYAEIAEELGISINSVKTHIKRAYRRFRLEVHSNSVSSICILFILRLLNL